MTQVSNHQNELRQKSGRKCPREFDYKPAPGSIEVFDDDDNIAAISSKQKLPRNKQKLPIEVFDGEENAAAVSNNKQKLSCNKQKLIKTIKSNKSCSKCNLIDCIQKDCRECKFCKNKKIYGGPGTLKQACKTKVCSSVNIETNIPTSPPVPAPFSPRRSRRTRPPSSLLTPPPRPKRPRRH